MKMIMAAIETRNCEYRPIPRIRVVRKRLQLGVALTKKLCSVDEMLVLLCFDFRVL